MFYFEARVEHECIFFVSLSEYSSGPESVIWTLYSPSLNVEGCCNSDSLSSGLFFAIYHLLVCYEYSPFNFM